MQQAQHVLKAATASNSAARLPLSGGRVGAAKDVTRAPALAAYGPSPLPSRWSSGSAQRHVLRVQLCDRRPRRWRCRPRHPFSLSPVHGPSAPAGAPQSARKQPQRRRRRAGRLERRQCGALRLVAGAPCRALVVPAAVARRATPPTAQRGLAGCAAVVATGCELRVSARVSGAGAGGGAALSGASLCPFLGQPVQRWWLRAGLLAIARWQL
jgi:hypothetical protein